MRLSSLKTDKKKEVDGVWCNSQFGFKYLIARMNNSAHRRYLQENIRPSQLLLSVDKQEDLTKEAISRFVLLDWKEVVDDQDKEIPYTPEIGQKTFEEYPDIYLEVLNFASSIDLFREDGFEDNAGNLKSVSSGS